MKKIYVRPAYLPGPEFEKLLDEYSAFFADAINEFKEEQNRK